jgi:hypothetical protein
MTLAYGTILDCKFLPQGLALYRSFERYVQKGRFYFFAMDDVAAHLLARIDLPRAEIVGTSAVSHPELEAQRGWRTFPEFCWASKPLAIRYMLARDGDARWACYLDSDMAFFADPDAEFDAVPPDVFGLFTPHRFSPAFQSWPARVGWHNGGFGAFRRGADAERVLARWLRGCLERPDSIGRNGETFDQKVLDQIAREERGVRSLDHAGINLAPWNVDNYRMSEIDGRPCADERLVTIYHFQSLRMHSARLYTLYNADKPIAGALRRAVYRPYVRLLRSALRELNTADPNYRPLMYPLARSGRSLVRVLFETAIGRRSIAAIWP